MWFDGYRCRLRTASQSCTNWIRCSSGRPWEIMWTGILSIMWWISCMLYWDSAWSQSLTVSIAGIKNSHLNIPKLYQQKEATPFSFPLKKKKKSELLSSEYTDYILSQCGSRGLDLFWCDHAVVSPSDLASPSAPEIEGLSFDSSYLLFVTLQRKYFHSTMHQAGSFLLHDMTRCQLEWPV